MREVPRSGTMGRKPHKPALSLLSISDHVFTGEALSAEERQNSFTDMMEVALETARTAAE